MVTLNQAIQGHGPTIVDHKALKSRAFSTQPWGFCEFGLEGVVASANRSSRMKQTVLATSQPMIGLEVFRERGGFVAADTTLCKGGHEEASSPELYAQGLEAVNLFPVAVSYTAERMSSYSLARRLKVSTK